jgi:hypothetical protein
MITTALASTIAVRLGLAVAIAVGAAATALADSKAKVKMPEVIRCFENTLMDVVQQGITRSSTLRDLIDRLERQHVIVFLRSANNMPPATAGRTRLITASGSWRYLSIEVSDRLSKVELLALLAHELQHAVEIADAPDVVDEASLVAMYHRLGADTGRTPGTDGIWFETQAAIDTGRRVLTELFGSW